jgi:L-galactose dehydrogenase/L-glyceraldehyde 3-phosphate reductase
VLAGGALSGQIARHPIAIPAVAPIASGPDYATDVERARAFEPLVAEGYASSVIEAAFRFALTTDALSTVLIGTSDLSQLEFAATAVARVRSRPTLDLVFHLGQARCCSVSCAPTTGLPSPRN